MIVVGTFISLFSSYSRHSEKEKKCPNFFIILGFLLFLLFGVMDYYFFFAFRKLTRDLQKK